MTKLLTRWAALAAFFSLPLTPLVVVDDWLFPFVTGKAFVFRILVEAGVGAWIALALVDRDYRPRFTWLGAAAAGFVAWLLAADLASGNAARAFWGNCERMEGWILAVHLLGFFFAAGAVLRTERKWRAWFLWSALVSLAVSGYALAQISGLLPQVDPAQVDAGFGNPAYLAVYLLHHLFTFETLYAYLGLFAVLACLDAPPGHGVRLLWRPTRASALAWPRFALPAAGTAAVIWLVNAPGIAVAAGCISVSGPMGSARILATFRSVLARSPFDGLEIRETLVDLAGEVAAIPGAMTREDRQLVSFALSETRRQVDRYPQDVEARLLLADAHRASGDPQAALGELKAALRLSPRQERIWIALGEVERDLGHPEAAWRCHDTADALAAGYRPPHPTRVRSDPGVRVPTWGRSGWDVRGPTRPCPPTAPIAWSVPWVYAPAHAGFRGHAPTHCYLRCLLRARKLRAQQATKVAV